MDENPIPANKVSVVQRGAEGPDALQIEIKALMAVSDLEGWGPSQPRIIGGSRAQLSTTAFGRQISSLAA